MFLKGNDRLVGNALYTSYLVNEGLSVDVVNSIAWLKEFEQKNIDVDEEKFILAKASSFQNFEGVLRMRLRTQHEASKVVEEVFPLNPEPALPGVTKVFSTLCNKPTLLKILSNDEVIPPLATRIFKREFLTEKQLRFNEKIGDDAELLFTVEAMFQTEEIIFASNVFYIAPK